MLDPLKGISFLSHLGFLRKTLAAATFVVLTSFLSPIKTHLTLVLTIHPQLTDKPTLISHSEISLHSHENPTKPSSNLHSTVNPSVTTPSAFFHPSSTQLPPESLAPTTNPPPHHRFSTITKPATQNRHRESLPPFNPSPSHLQPPTTSTSIYTPTVTENPKPFLNRRNPTSTTNPPSTIPSPLTFITFVTVYHHLRPQPPLNPPRLRPYFSHLHKPPPS